MENDGTAFAITVKYKDSFMLTKEAIKSIKDLNALIKLEVKRIIKKVITG